MHSREQIHSRKTGGWSIAHLDSRLRPSGQNMISLGNVDIGKMSQLGQESAKIIRNKEEEYPE